MRRAVAAALLLATMLPCAAVTATRSVAPGRLAVVQGGDNSRIRLLNPDGSGARNLVPSGFGVQSPTWRPDGRALAFVSSRGGSPGIYLVNDDGSRLRPLIVRGRTGKGDPAFSPDGRHIAYTRSFRGTDLLVARADASEPRNLVRTGGENNQPSWSPDGKRIAFVRGTLGDELSISVVTVANGRVRRLTGGSEDWNASPAWAPNGRSIAFVRQPQNSDRGRIAVIRPDGTGIRFHAPRFRDVTEVAWSPDGRELVFTRKIAPDSEIFRLRLSDGSVRKVTRNGISDTEPAWGPARR